MTRMIENNAGVHALHPLNWKTTLCGDAVHAASSDAPDGPFSATSETLVTCPRCIRIIAHCRLLRYWDC